MPIGRHWNYFPGDTLKSTGGLVRYLCRATARGGNYLLGIGPDASGEFDAGVVTSLHGVGSWLRQHGEAIYGTAPMAPYEEGDCLFTARRDGTHYAIILAGTDEAQVPEQVVVPEAVLKPGGRISLLPFDVTLTAEPAGSGKRLVRVPAWAAAKLAPGMAWVIKFAPQVETGT